MCGSGLLVVLLGFLIFISLFFGAVSVGLMRLMLFSLVALVAVFLVGAVVMATTRIRKK